MSLHNLLKLVLIITPLLGVSTAYPQTQTPFTPSTSSATNDVGQLLKEKATAAFKFKADILGNFVRGAEKQAISLADNDFTLHYVKKYDEADRANLTVLFHAVSAANADYMQVRFLDSNGVERVRIDRRKGEDIPYVVPVEEMQDKSGKTYFKALKDFQAGDTWHSNVNLNMERGAIEQPIRPTFRISTPVYSEEGFRGVVVINLIMDRILQLLTYSSDFDIAMVDRDGEIIAHPNPEKAWSRYLPDREKFKPEQTTGIDEGVQPYSFPLAEIFSNDDQANLVLIPKQSLITSLQASKTTQISVELTAEEKAWIKAHPEIRYIALRDWSPIDYQDANGAHTGIATDIIALAADRVGLNLKPEFGPWAEMLDKLIAGKIDLAPEIYHTEDRAKHLAYSRAYLSLYDAIFTVPKSDILSPADLAGKTVAVEKGYAMEEILKKDYPGAKLFVVESTVSALQAVAVGDADAYIGSQYVASYLSNEHLIHGIQAITLFSSRPQNLHLAVPKDRAILRDILEKGLNSISEKEAHTIIGEYVPDIEFKEEKSLVKLSDKENAWLKEHPVLRVHNEQNWAPFNFYDNDQPKGYSIDYMNLLAQRLGIEVSYVTGPSWNEFLDMVKAKELDVMLNIVNTEERRKYINFTDNYLHTLTGIYVQTDAPSITSLKELEGKTVSIPKGFFEQELLERYYPKVNLHLVRNNLEAFEAVLFGKADAALGEMAVTNFLMLKHSLTGLHLSGKVADERFDNILNIGVREDWPILRDILQKAMDSITQEEEQLLKKKWIALPEFKEGPQIKFSAEEKAWLASNPALRLGYDTDWPPVEYVDEKGQYHGMSADYMALIGKSLGITIEPIPPQSWRTTIEDAKARRIDILSAVAPLPEREAYLNFTQPYLSFPMVIVTRQDVSYIGSLRELEGKRVAVVSDYASHNILKDSHPDLVLYPTKNVLEGLEAVHNDDAYAFVGSLATISHVLSREKIVGLKVSGETPYSYELAIGARNDQPILVGLMQKALDAITEEQRTEIYNRWVAVSYEKATDYTLLWQVFLVTALVIIFIVYWNRRLKMAVNQKTSELRDVLASLEEKVEERTAELHERERNMWDLYENAPVAYATLESDGVFINHNRAFAELLKKSRSAFDSLKWSEIAPDDTEVFQATLDGQSLIDKELPIQLDDGDVLQTTVSAIPIRDDEGEINEVRLTLMDITERKASRERFEALMESAPDAMIVVDHQGTLVLVNSQVEKVFGYTRDELLGEKIEILVPEEIREQHVGYRNSYIESPWPAMTRTALDFRGQRKDGTQFPAEVSLSPIESKDGHLVVASVRDITARKESEKHIAQSNRDLATLTLVNEAVMKSTTENQLMNETCRILVKENTPIFAWIGFEDRRNKKVTVEARYGYEKGFIEHLRLSWANDDINHCPSGKVIRTAKPVLIKDIANDDMSVEWRDEAMKRGYRSSTSVPLRQYGDAFAVLNVYSDVIGKADVDRIKLLERIADNLAHGIIALRSESARKQAEEELTRAEERSRLLLKSAGEGVFGVDTNGVIAFVNPRCSTQLGYMEEELMGNQAHTLFHHSHADGSEYPAQECWMYKSFTEGNSYRVDDEVLWRKDGTSFPVEYNSTPIFRDEKLVGAVISFNDITERLAAQRERDSALEVISSSIAYATNIQHAILPPKTCLDVISSDHFVHWEPRDQVGGDMYWCKPWGLGKLLALGDCTGHGVPGAFMTMIANGALDMATMETMPGDTGTLLQRSHQLIQQELNQELNQHLQEGGSDDGLELGVCYIERKRKKMNYSGARFSLFHVDNGVVTEIKGDKKGIGYRGIPRDVPFTTHEVELLDSGTFYMTSDGLTDQIGGDKRRGFGKRRFKDLLCDIESLPLEEQRARIERALVEYQGEEKRRDDVSVVGFRL